ncbi:MAG TPA: cell division topological specificity factor MinE [Stellaceae bacterium]|nr:cell division topological specificity factor MinE [Stellaceae bacterium]
MSILDRLFGRRPRSAAVAKERLQIVLQHERAGRSAPDFLPILQREILAVVGKYLDVTDDMIQVDLEKRGEISMLEINVELDKAKIKPRPPERKVEEGFVRWTAPAG